MTPAALLADLAAAGFRLRVEAGRLLVSPASNLTADQRVAIAQHRDALLALVTVEEADDPFDWLPPPAELWAATLAYQRRRGSGGVAPPGAAGASSPAPTANDCAGGDCSATGPPR